MNVGKNKAPVIRRAHILLKSDEGRTDKEIADWLYISEETVRRVRQRFCAVGLEATLAGQAYPERAKTLSGEPEAYLIALACSEPPEGQACWTMELLAKQLETDEVATVSAETVRLTLKKQTETVAGQELVHSYHHQIVLAAHGSHFAIVCSVL